MKKKYLLSCISGIALFVAQSSTIFASTETASFTVNAATTGSGAAASTCTIGNINPINFGVLDLDNVPTSVTWATGSFTVNCTSGTSYTVTIDDGQYVEGGIHGSAYAGKMVVNNDPNMFIFYQLFTVQQWGSDIWYPAHSTKTNIIGNGSDQLHNIYAGIYQDHWQQAKNRGNIPAGSTLSDAATIELTF